MKVTWDPGLEILPAISPDGKSVAYGSGTIINMRIYVRPVAGGRGIQLTDDTSGVQAHPRWSPDGTRILFLAGGGVFSAPAAGGPARPELPPGRPTPIISAACVSRRQDHCLRDWRFAVPAERRRNLASPAADRRGQCLHLVAERSADRLWQRQCAWP